MRSPSAEVPAAEVPAAEVSPAEVSAAIVAAAVVPAAVVPAAVSTAGIPVSVVAAVAVVAAEGERGERFAEEEPGEKAGAEAEAAPVRGCEAGVDVADRRAVDLHIAQFGLDAVVDLASVVGARWDGAARPAARRRPVDVAHRHAMPRVEEARRAPLGPRLAGREGVRAGQVVLPFGDGTADRAHVLDASGGIERRGAPFVSGQGRGLFLGRLRVALDGDVRIAVGEPVAERDQVV